MYKIQKGFLPLALLIIGMITIMYSLIVIFALLAKPIIFGKLELPSDFEQRVLFYLVAFPLLTFGLYLISIFPWIRLSKVGLKYRGLLFNGTVKWAEIDNLVELKGRIILLSIAPKRFFLLKGLLFQRFTGMLLGYEHPVILLSPGLQQREQILKEIMANSPAKEIRKTSDPYS
jgi:hypothetical protein